MKSNTWLPVFSGFYNSIFECDFDEEFDFLSSEHEIPEELIHFFYSSDLYFKECNNYYRKASEKITEIMERELKALGFLKSIKFEALKKPKEYNFNCDSIDIEVVFTKENIQNIKRFLTENHESWTEYLGKKYTSCDGFMSSYDGFPESKDWIDIDECLSHSHKCGSILDFLCNENKITEETIYSDMDVRPYLNIEQLKEDFIEHSV